MNALGPLPDLNNFQHAGCLPPVPSSPPALAAKPVVQVAGAKAKAMRTMKGMPMEMKTERRKKRAASAVAAAAVLDTVACTTRKPRGLVHPRVAWSYALFAMNLVLHPVGMLAAAGRQRCACTAIVRAPSPALVAPRDDMSDPHSRAQGRCDKSLTRAPPSIMPLCFKPPHCHARTRRPPRPRTQAEKDAADAECEECIRCCPCCCCCNKDEASAPAGAEATSTDTTVTQQPSAQGCVVAQQPVALTADGLSELEDLKRRVTALEAKFTVQLSLTPVVGLAAPLALPGVAVGAPPPAVVVAAAGSSISKAAASVFPLANSQAGDVGYVVVETPSVATSSVPVPTVTSLAPAPTAVVSAEVVGTLPPIPGTTLAAGYAPSPAAAVAVPAGKLAVKTPPRRPSAPPTRPPPAKLQLSPSGGASSDTEL